MVATSEQQAGSAVAGKAILKIVEDLIRPHLVPGIDELTHDMELGHYLMLAVFMAARGDGSVNRIFLIQGVGQAIGEALAQQVPTIRDEIMERLNQGLSAGQGRAAAVFPQTVGEA